MNEPQETVAVSTIAMTIYNLCACKSDKTWAIADLKEPLEAFFGFDLLQVELEAALVGLVEYGYVTMPTASSVQARGPQGVVVRSRDRSEDGWDGWKLHMNNALVAFEEIVK